MPLKRIMAMKFLSIRFFSYLKLECPPDIMTAFFTYGCTLFTENKSRDIGANGEFRVCIIPGLIFPNCTAYPTCQVL